MLLESEVCMQKYKKLLFIIFVVTLGFINFKFFSDLHLNFIERLLIRFPQVLLVLYIYKKHIEVTNKQHKRAWRIKNDKLHWLVFIGGFIELIVLIVRAASLEKHDPLDISFLTSVNPLEIITSLAIMIPIYYFFVQYGLLLFKLNTWAFSKNKKYLLLILILDDLLITSLISLLA